MDEEAIDKIKILVVDDDTFIREMIEDALSGHYQIISAESGADALMLAETERPAAILLDVELPGMDGYETCRRLKEIDSTAGIPVIFVSGHDRIEDRLKGYEAGGEDYVVKPFELEELEAKVGHLLRLLSERGSLKEMADYAGRTAMTAMTSLGELGALLESLKNFNACSDYQTLAKATLAGLTHYDLQGAVQIRVPDETLTFTSQGEATPLEESVITHMAGMDRIVQFKSRLSISYDHISLLVNNMPVDDPDRCGRLRDHLAMLVEGAEVRAQAMLAGIESQRRGKAIEQAIKRITETLSEIDSAQRQSRIATGMEVNNFTDKMEQAYISVALSEPQETFMAKIVSEGLDSILNAQSAEIDVQDKLTTIIHELKAISGSKA